MKAMGHNTYLYTKKILMIGIGSQVAFIGIFQDVFHPRAITFYLFCNSENVQANSVPFLFWRVSTH